MTARVPRLAIAALAIGCTIAAEPAPDATPWRALLDPELSQWEVFIGVPHGSVGLPGVPADSDGVHGTPLGLGRDPRRVFSVERAAGEPVLHVSGEVYGGLTTREQFGDFHLRLQMKWGVRKWQPRAEAKRDSGILYHATGPHGAFWNVWKRSLEFQIEEGNIGDLFPLAGALAEVATAPRGRLWFFDPAGAPRLFGEGAGVASFQAKRSDPRFESAAGEWNTLELIALGRTALHVVNGHVVLVLHAAAVREEGGAVPLTRGQIQLQSEGAEVFFRRVEIRPIAEIPREFAATPGVGAPRKPALP
jgi:hypothetical protein